MVQITLFIFQFDFLFVEFLGRTGWCAVKGSPDTGPSAEDRFWQHWLANEHLVLFYCCGNNDPLT